MANAHQLANSDIGNLMVEEVRRQVVKYDTIGVT